MATAVAKRTDIGAVEARLLVRQICEHADNLRKLLTKLRDGRGWMALGYANWAVCCEKEFGYSKQHTNRLIKAEEVRQITEATSQVEPMGSTNDPDPMDPSLLPQLPERQARELAKVPAKQRSDVLNRVIEQTDGKVTAAAIKEAVTTPICPNCGGREFDEDGDCIGCHEPEVAHVEPSVEDRMKEANSKLESLGRAITAHLNDAEELGNPHLDEQRLNILKSQLKTAAGTIRAAKGAARCAYCDGDGCKHCYQTGWLNKVSAEAAPR